MSDVERPSAPCCIAVSTSASMRRSCSARRLHVLRAEHDLAHLGRAHERAEVDGGPRAAQRVEVAAEVRPVHLDLVLVEPGPLVLQRGLGDGRRRASFARDLRGDALADLRLRAVVREQRHLGLAEHVDEAGRDHVVAGVDAARRRRLGEIADGGDVVALDADVAAEPGRAGAVHDAAARDDEVERGRRLRPHGRRGQQSAAHRHRRQDPVHSAHLDGRRIERTRACE